MGKLLEIRVGLLFFSLLVRSKKQKGYVKICALVSWTNRLKLKLDNVFAVAKSKKGDTVLGLHALFLVATLMKLVWENAFRQKGTLPARTFRELTIVQFLKIVQSGVTFFTVAKKTKRVLM